MRNSTRPTASAPLKNQTSRNIKQVVLGTLRFNTWFDSRYPEELVQPGIETLFVCHACFRYSCDSQSYVSHVQICQNKKQRLGTCIYDAGNYSVWEVDGEDEKLFAQNLSLFAKLFLDHKSVFFDVSSFLYYILVYTNPNDPSDRHILGYFSKEKMSWDANNLACILIFPPYQHKQLGKLLMGISYKLSAWEWEGGVIGGPEKPLSEMGRKSYVRFWEERIARYLLVGSSAGSSNRQDNTKRPGRKKGKKVPVREEMSVRDIGQATGMLVEDVITALQSMGVVDPQKPTKRKRGSHADEKGHSDRVIIKKSKVLAWAKSRNMSLLDPVVEEGFHGEWAPEEAESEDF
ncbi:hypothetical protein FQN57_004946 [Myotisia sp. PD_48]|nr:hypothetical protein FQN57_004946 [Myotisia sp. PD_48]